MREAPRHVAGSSYSTITDVIVNVPFHSKTSLQCASSVSSMPGAWLEFALPKASAISARHTAA
jgi:hypothetical protein